MAFKFNPITATLDLVGTASGNVTGPVTSTDKGIARYNGTSGTLIQDSTAILQDGGAIAAQGFITNRSITGSVVIDSNFSMLAANIEIEGGEIVIEQDGELIIL